ncbi:hypothetical protein KFS98_003674 [Salmonella enterica]|nr:hypothetical protein [Salmonella enterica]
MIIKTVKQVFLCTKKLKGSPSEILEAISVDLATTGLGNFEVSPINRTVKADEVFELKGYEYIGEEVRETEIPEPAPAEEVPVDDENPTDDHIEATKVAGE